ncbi:MAG: TPM domain-containing protein [Burkholderiales bacterium]
MLRLPPPPGWLRRLGMLCALLLLLVGAAALAADGPLPVPPLQALVTDQTGTLTPAQRTTLETRLREFEARKGSQLAVLLVATTQPEAVEQYSLRVAEQWKLGRKQVDDGALLLVAKNDRAVRIEVGYGLEGVLGDAVSKRLIDEVIVPRFKQGDYYGGLDAATDRIIRLVDGEALPAPAVQPGGAGQPDIGGLVPVLLMVALVAGGVLRAVLGRLPGAVVTAGVAGVIGWFLAGTLALALVGALVAFFVTLFGGGLGALGGWTRQGGGHYRGGGGFGGGGGGGFGGGGGGGFGGGGASGRW